MGKVLNSDGIAPCEKGTVALINGEELSTAWGDCCTIASTIAWLVTSVGLSICCGRTNCCCRRKRFRCDTFFIQAATMLSSLGDSMEPGVRPWVR